MATHVIKLGSRKSDLALTQTREVQTILKDAYPKIEFPIETMETIGDKILDVSLQKIGEKSLFTKELEVALAAYEVDMVVHSLKDLPTLLPEGMTIGAILEREDPRDTVVFHPKYRGLENLSLDSLPADALIGTSSLRRSAQLKRHYPNFRYEAVRGNINTRLRKLNEENKYDALILAAAGLKRLNFGHLIGQYLESDKCYHAVGQGALAVECRVEDKQVINLLRPLNHLPTVYQCTAERAFLNTLQGGCSVPVGVSSSYDSDSETVSLIGSVFSLDGQKSIVTNASETLPGESFEESAIDLCRKLGSTVANKLLEQGAEAILLEARRESTV